jgi:hypothetical protein
MMPPAVHPVHLVLGLIVWSAWFVAMYGGLSVACAVAPPGASAGALTWINGVLLLLTVVTAAALLYAAWWCWRALQPAAGDARVAHFIAGVSAALYLASSVAVVAVGMPTIVLPPCV